MVGLSQRTCKIDGCESPIGKKGAKGMCPYHYRHSRPPCVIDGCGKKQAANGFCAMHNYRYQSTGNPHTTASGRVVGHAGKTCEVTGCDNPRRKRAWCAAHYSMWTRLGVVKPFARKWADEGSLCPICGDEAPRRRKYCSVRCRGIAARWRAETGRKDYENIPRETTCQICESTIELFIGPRKRRVDVELCDACRRTRYSTRHKYPLGLLVKQKGDNCGLCGLRVDTSLPHTDPLSAAIDHIVPFSLGGSHDVENLQITHRTCNSRKHNKEDFHLNLLEVLFDS